MNSHPRKIKSSINRPITQSNVENQLETCPIKYTSYIHLLSYSQKYLYIVTMVGFVLKIRFQQMVAILGFSYGWKKYLRKCYFTAYTHAYEHNYQKLNTAIFFLSIMKQQILL